MLNIKKITLIIFLSLSSNSVFSEDTARKAKRVESLKARQVQTFKEIQDAFNSENHAQVEILLSRLSSEIEASKKGGDYRFYTLLSEGNISEAKKAAEKLLEKDDLHIMDRARIHNALGNAYLASDNLDNALAEYKKIIALRDN